MKKAEKQPKLIKELIKDQREALEVGKLEANKYNKTSNYIYKPTRSRFKIKFWFNDGNEKTFFSYDAVQQPDKTYIIDEWTGLTKLIRLANKWKDQYKCAVIFINLDLQPKPHTKNYSTQVMKFLPDKNFTNKKLVFDQKGNVKLDYFKVK